MAAFQASCFCFYLGSSWYLEPFDAHFLRSRDPVTPRYRRLFVFGRAFWVSLMNSPGVNIPGSTAKHTTGEVALVRIVLRRIPKPLCVYLCKSLDPFGMRDPRLQSGTWLAALFAFCDVCGVNRPYVPQSRQRINVLVSLRRGVSPTHSRLSFPALSLQIAPLIALAKSQITFGVRHGRSAK